MEATTQRAKGEPSQTGDGPAANDGPTFILFRLLRELRDAVYEKAFALLDLPNTVELGSTLFDKNLQGRLESLMTDRLGELEPGSLHEKLRETIGAAKSKKAQLRPLPGVLPPFCYTNRQMFFESLPIFVRQRNFVLESNDGVLKLGHLSVGSLTRRHSRQFAS
jgi:hypothetical protein